MTHSRRVTEKNPTCPQCKEEVQIKEEDGKLILYNLDGRLHRCIEKKPIGQAIQGRLIEGFSLQGRRATLYLDGGMEFEIRALDYVPLFLRLVDPDGKVLEEG